jgi:DNA modification methylase/ParB-like chromosome segregation protein Spo0J
MKLIHVDAVRVAADRQRRLFDEGKLREFGDIIEQQGLLHPIILRVVGDDYILVAGERRLRAIRDLYELGRRFHHDGQLVAEHSIPYTLLSDLDPLAAEEAELSENIHREALTWQERAAAHSRLAALRTAQAAASGLAPPRVADISLEVRGSSEGVNQETTRRELIVAKHLGNPAVKAAKTVDEAFKILRREEQRTKHQELGVSVGKTFTAEHHQAFNEDSLRWMERAAPGQFDCILTDPPYGMGADEFGDSGGLAAGGHGYEDSLENFQEILSVLATQSYRLTKDQAHLYCFCDIDQYAVMKQAFSIAGWMVFRTPLIWYKRGGMRAPWPEWGPQRKYETILYAIKGRRPILKMLGDVLDYAPDANLGHAAQKPVALFTDLLSRTCLPGNAVLDPFAGSGPVFSAAHGLKVRATGVELDQASYGIMCQRIAALKEAQDLDLSLGVVT